MRRLLAVVLTAVIGLAIVPATSHASAYGIQYFSTFSWNGWTIPGGQLAHMISGSGYHINWDGANFGAVGNLCDPSIRFTYGNGTRSFRGNVHWGCSHVGQWKYALNWNVPRGQACAELWIFNWRKYVTKQCHYVHG